MDFGSTYSKTGTTYFASASPSPRNTSPSFTPFPKIPENALSNVTLMLLNALDRDVRTFPPSSAKESLNFLLCFHAPIRATPRAITAAITPMAAAEVKPKPLVSTRNTPINGLSTCLIIPRMYSARVVRAFLISNTASFAPCIAAIALKTFATNSFSKMLAAMFTAVVKVLKNAIMLPDSLNTAMNLAIPSMNLPNAGAEPLMLVNATPRVSTARETLSKNSPVPA